MLFLLQLGESIDGALAYASGRIPFLPSRTADVNWTHLILATAFLYFAQWIIQTVISYLQIRLHVRGLPAIHSCVEVFESGLRNILPHIPFICPVKAYTFDDPFRKYATARSDLIALTTPTLPYAVYLTSNPRAGGLLTSHPERFIKPTNNWRYQAINLFGRQIVSVSGDEWRRHRAVVRGCFGEGVLRNGWEKMVNAVDVMVAAQGVEKGGVVLDVQKTMIKVTLLVIGQAGFGLDVPWDIPRTDGMELPFIEALQEVESNILAQLLIPVWLMNLAPVKSFNRMGKARRSLITHLDRMIRSKRAELDELNVSLGVDEERRPPTDLYGALVAAQMDTETQERVKQGEKVAGLTDSEIRGNLFIFIIAGHETTGNTLAFTLAYLALHPDWQGKLHAEITSICGDRPLEYGDVPHLRLVLAAATESMRMRDIVAFIGKRTTSTSVIPYTTWDDDGRVYHHTRVLPAGSQVVLDNPAAHQNPFFWPNPNIYDPSRHLGASNSPRRPRAHSVSFAVGSTEAVTSKDESVHTAQVKPNEGSFFGFSQGPRACIGKRFAEVEMVAFLATVVQRYTLHPVAKDGETRERMYKRMTEGKEGLTLTPGKFDIRFDPR